MTDSHKNPFNAPLAIPALAFGAGITYARTDLPFSLFIGCLTVALTAWHLLQKNWRPQLQFSYLLVTLSFALVGFFHLRQAVLPYLEPQLQKLSSSRQEVVLSGILRSAPGYNGNKGNFIVDADIYRTADGNEITIDRPILVKTAFQPEANLLPGNRILFRARLSTPSLPGTPGSFNYQQYLADRHIQIIGYIRSPAHLQCFMAANLPDKLLRFSAYTSQKLRHKVNLSIDSADLSIESQALYKAIITGQRDEIPVTVFESFKRSGAVHLLAISGMHLAMLALLSTIFINFLLNRSASVLLRFQAWKISAIITMIVMACYTTVSGLHPPVVRAFIMITALITAIFLDRPSSMLNGIALAAILILGWDPVLLFSASFQMSFAAVTSIVLFINNSPRQRDNPDQTPPLVKKYKKWLLDSLSVSVMALIATAPISLYHFKQISILSPITTILAAPLICFWALPLGLVASLLSPWLPAISGLFFSTGSIGLQVACLVTARLSALPFAAWQLPPPSLFVISCYYMSAFLLLVYAKNRLFQIVAMMALLMIMIASVIIPFPPRMENSTLVTFIDTGQGSSALLELPGNKNILVDGGGNSSPRFDPGEQIITLFLWQKGIRHLDAVIISHVHHDHYNGLESVIRNFKPDTVWINGSPESSLTYSGILKSATGTGAEIIVPEEGTEIMTSGPAKLTCLSALHLRENPELEENNRSLVIELTVAGKKFILPGDIMAADGSELLEKGIELKSDVLLAPHHGSRHSAGYELARQGRPDWLVVSASPLYSGKFPDPAFAKWCEGKNIELINLADLGSVSFEVDQHGQISWQTISAKGRSATK